MEHPPLYYYSRTFQGIVIPARFLAGIQVLAEMKTWAPGKDIPGRRPKVRL